jgi:hypothetical protein
MFQVRQALRMTVQVRDLLAHRLRHRTVLLKLLVRDLPILRLQGTLKVELGKTKLLYNFIYVFDSERDYLFRYHFDIGIDT